MRGGFGIIFQPSALQAAGTTGGAGTDGFTSQTNFNFTLDNQQTVNTTFDNPAPTGYNLPQGAAGGPGTFLGLGIGDTFFDSYRNPYSEEANLSVQRQLPENMVITVGYIYNAGHFLINGDPGVPFSQVDPSYLKLGQQLLNSVPNPFYGIITTPGSPLAAPTGTVQLSTTAVSAIQWRVQLPQSGLWFSLQCRHRPDGEALLSRPVRVGRFYWIEVDG